MKAFFNYRFLLGISIIAFTFLLVYFLSKPSYIDVAKLEPKHKVEARTIIELGANKKTNNIKANDVVEVIGVIKEINFLNNRTTIYLGSNTQDSTFIICDMQNSEKDIIAQLNSLQTVKLKGIFKGFLTDAILLDCVISQ